MKIQRTFITSNKIKIKNLIKINKKKNKKKKKSKNEIRVRAKYINKTERAPPFFFMHLQLEQ